MTIREVYEYVLEEAKYHETESDKFAKEYNHEMSNKHFGLSQAFYQVAARLEQTEEINSLGMKSFVA